MKKYLTTKFLLLSALTLIHSLFIFETSWYDESAVIANASKVSITDYFQGLSWLQSLPLGYFLVVKMLLELPHGLYLCRIVSLIALVLATIILDREFFSKLKNKYLNYLALILVMVNSFSLKYATDVKPYTAELLLSTLILVAVKKSKFKVLYPLTVLAPFIASTCFIVGISSMLVMTLRLKTKKLFAPLTILVFTTWVSSQTTPMYLRRNMANAWFGDSDSGFLPGIKTTVGALFWLPTSGMGWLPENLSQITRYYYEVSASVFVLALALIFANNAKDVNFQILATCTLVLTTLNITQILPSAGRLIQGFCVLLSILVFRSLDKSRNSNRKRISVILLGTISVAINLGAKIDSFEPYNPSINFSQTGKIFTERIGGPEIEYRALRQGLIVESNLILEIKDNFLLGCSEGRFGEKDRFYLESNQRFLFGSQNYLTFHEVSSGFGYYSSNKEISIKRSQDPMNSLICFNRN